MNPYCPFYIELIFNLNKLLLIQYNCCSFSIIIAHPVLLLPNLIIAHLDYFIAQLIRSLFHIGKSAD
jgi:hypothetical protein